MPFLLMILLTLVCLPDLERDNKPFWPEHDVRPEFVQSDAPGRHKAFWPEPFWGQLPVPFGLSPAVWSMLLTGAATGFVGCYAFWAARRVAGPLRREPQLRERVLWHYERRRFTHQILLFGLLGLALGVFGWGWAVDQFWRSAELGLWPCAELVVVAPFFVAMLLSWLFFYDAERAAHQTAYQSFDLDPLARALLDANEYEANLRQHEARRDFGGRWAYVLFQMRQKLALVFLPVGMLLAAKELQRRFSDALGDWQLAISFLACGGILLAFVAMPWVVRLGLGLKPLPSGPLRQRLEAAAKRLRFRCSNLLVWNTRNGMGNAMVIGLLPWPRYVVFTDRLLEDFTPDEVEAVFGHEVGHIKHHHMFYYLGFLSTSIAVLMPLFVADANYLETLPLICGLLLYFFVVFGFVSRRCERQADVYGCRAVSCTSPDCRAHGDGVLLAERGRGLCATGIRTFIRALEKVAVINGISRDRPGILQSWQHSTIAKRVAFLQRVLDDPRVERTFQRRVLLVKWGLAVTLGTALAALLFMQI